MSKVKSVVSITGAKKLGALPGRSSETGEGTLMALSETHVKPLKREGNVCQRLIFL